MRVTGVKPNPADLLANFGTEVYKEAYSKQRSLSAHLEEIIPARDFREAGEENLDSFQILLRVADINPGTDIERGYWADDFDKFLQSDNTRALVPEWMSRQWRKARGQRNIYISSDQTDGSIARPYSDAQQVRWDTQLAPAIPLSELVAITTPVDGDAYRAFYMTSNTEQTRMVRVTEGSELPRVKMVGGERTIKLLKFGRAIEISYESLRRMKIDMVALHVQRMAVQAEIDKVAWAMDVLINGDGNANTAATVHTLTSLDTNAVAGTLTLEGWLRFRMQFPNPYFPTTTLANEDMVLQALLLNTGSGNQPLMSLPPGVMGGLNPINPGLANSLRIGWTSDAPASKFLTFDRRIALQHLTEVGADISEVERYISRQTQLMTLSEVEGFAVIDGNATRILNVAA